MVTNASLYPLLNRCMELFSSKPTKGFGKFFGEGEDKEKGNGEQYSSDDKKTDAVNRKPDKSKWGLDFKLEFKEKQESSGERRSRKGPDDQGNYNDRTPVMIGSIIVAGITIIVAYNAYYGRSEISWKEFIRYRDVAE